MKKNKVVIGMSGGVDSSVAALLLKEQGYDVIGLFMRNWREEDENSSCTAEEDYADVRRVSALLDIPYYTVDFSREYMEKVFTHFLDEYKKGRTPNPDVLCNREIKFGPFKDYAERLGANYIATGHYAATLNRFGKTYLLRAKDENKDQTYFLNQLNQQQLSNTLFPLANLTKPEVRSLADRHNLATADKKDSTGICFIGERDFRKFLSSYLPMQEGDIKTLDGRTVGRHNGVFYYTIGQRKGFGLGGGGTGEPYYIIYKDIYNNILYVNQGECPELFSKELIVEDFNFITDPIKNGARILARIRHRQPLMPATAYFTDEKTIRLVFDNPVRAAAPGQYAVVYDDRICVGGGTIADPNKDLFSKQKP